MQGFYISSPLLLNGATTWPIDVYSAGFYMLDFLLLKINPINPIHAIHPACGACWI